MSTPAITHITGLKSTIKEDFCVTHWAVSSPVRGLACQPGRSILPSDLGAGGGELLATSLTLGCFSFWRCAFKKKKKKNPQSLLLITDSRIISVEEERRRRAADTARLSRCLSFCPANSVVLDQRMPCGYHFTSLLVSNCASCLPYKINKLKKKKERQRGSGRNWGMLYDNH